MPTIQKNTPKIIKSDRGGSGGSSSYATSSGYAVTSGYSLSSGNADTLDGFHAIDFSSTGHLHTGIYSSTGHIHDDRYYTESETDVRYSSTGHTHADLHSPFVLGTKTIDEGSIANGKAITYNSSTGGLIYSAVATSSEGMSFSVTSTGHGYITADLPLAMFHTSTGWEKAKADSEYTLATHVMISITDINTYVLSPSGRYLFPSHGFVINNYYFVSATTAGEFTSTEPAIYSNPLLFIEDENYFHVLQFRPGLNQTSYNPGDTAPVGGVINRIAGMLSSIDLDNGVTISITRDVNDNIQEVTNGTYTWIFSRDINGSILSWTVT